MTQRASVGVPRELRVIHLFLVKRVEDAAELRIDGGDLDNVTVHAPADVHVVVEIDRSWRARVDAVPLEARLGEDQHLRGRRDIKRLEHRREVAAFVIKRQFDFVGVEPLLKFVDRIGQRRRQVVDRFTLNIELCGNGQRNGRHGQKECETEHGNQLS